MPAIIRILQYYVGRRHREFTGRARFGIANVPPNISQVVVDIEVRPSLFLLLLALIEIRLCNCRITLTRFIGQIY